MTSAPARSRKQINWDKTNLWFTKRQNSLGDDFEILSHAPEQLVRIVFS